MLVRLIPLLLLLLVVLAAYLVLRQARSGGPDPAGRAVDRPDPSGPRLSPGAGREGSGPSLPPDPAARHHDAVQAARELVRQAEAAHARAVARAQERLTLAELEAQRDADGGRAEHRVEAARLELETVRGDTEELDRARMTLEDLEGAGPLRGDLPSAPPDEHDGVDGSGRPVGYDGGRPLDEDEDDDVDDDDVDDDDVDDDEDDDDVDDGRDGRAGGAR